MPAAYAGRQVLVRAYVDRAEGPYSEEVSHTGTNRLVKSLKDAGIGPGGNVYAELGATLSTHRFRPCGHSPRATMARESHCPWGHD